MDRRSALFGLGSALLPNLNAFVGAGKRLLPNWAAAKDGSSLVFAQRSSGQSGSGPFDRVLLTERALRNLPALLASDPAALDSWTGIEQKARSMLSAGYWDSADIDRSERYTYILQDWLPRFALLFAFSRNAELGSMIRSLTLDVLERPPEFWVHSDIRFFDSIRPVGGLETASLLRSVALTLSWADAAFSLAELTDAKSAIVRLGLEPCMRWLERPSANNWLATVASGVLVAGLVLKDALAVEKGTNGLLEWLKLVEVDGSYGEPLGYFNYALGHFFAAWWALGKSKTLVVLQSAPLKKSLRWYAYHYVLAENKGRAGEDVRKVNFGDDDYLGAPSPFVLESLAYAYGDGLGVWLSRRLVGGRQALSVFHLLFRLEIGQDGLPVPKDPIEVGLPLSAHFVTGLAFLRTGWSYSKDVLVALRSGGAARTGYVHDRPNRNALSVFVDGEYLVAAPGRASYRSPLRKAWDMRTASHSTLTIVGENQLDEPTARISGFEDAKEWGFVESEASAAYRGRAKIIRRIWLLHNPTILVIQDEVVPLDRLKVEVGFLVPFVVGRKFILSGTGWRIKDARVDALFAIPLGKTLEEDSNPAVVHNRYSYSPGDATEGRPGSGKRLVCRSETILKPESFWSLIVPRASSLTASSIIPDTVVSERAILRLSDGHSVQSYIVGRNQCGQAFFAELING